MYEIRTVTTLPEDMWDQILPEYYELRSDKPLDANHHDELRAMLNEGRIMMQKNPPVWEMVERYRKEMEDVPGFKEGKVIPTSISIWPDIPSQSFQIPSDEFAVDIEAEIPFSPKMLKVYTDDEGSFVLRDTIVRVKFASSDVSHTYYIPENHRFSASVDVGYANDDAESLRAFLFTSHPEKEFYEMDEFIMFSAIKPFYYRNYKEPKAIDDGRALITCFNKANNRLYIARTSFEHGSCEEDDVIISRDGNAK